MYLCSWTDTSIGNVYIAYFEIILEMKQHKLCLLKLKAVNS